MAIEPEESQLAAIAGSAGGPEDGPVLMLNLNRYRERADYESEPPAGGGRDVSGRDAYARYGAVAARVLERVGGRILWYARAEQTVIGGDQERSEDVIAVWYPSRSAFLELAGAPEIQEARVDRAAGLDRATLICCDPAPAPGPDGP